MFAAYGLRPAVVCEGDEPGATQDLISAGLGIGLVPAMSLRAAPHAPVAWARLDTPEARRTLSMVWRRDAHLSAAAGRFRDFAADHFRTFESAD
ncbi:hypothetical protein C1I98_29900 [Spongiactinospora gelatinilytica]|uniref:LysR substrate-binding domain-containing protein n=1 Tax=Spongiactinospora gelatinilytica TaxID=2666298 RepID=A0A2W2FP01_9ACTN|nr:LysR substrate-binding domain-containing protein [Spongiactinospora gelatinilytica]PZG31739.1 hypothetical protein C1I98_29900 [Spongiactinospora gelatinilytica]